MADSQIQLSTNVGTGKTLASWNDGADDHQKALIEIMVGSTPTKVSSSVPLPTTLADGGDVTLGAKADAASKAFDTTAITIMQVLKQLSNSMQALTAMRTAASATLTRPANVTAYTVGDAVANNATAGSVTLCSFSISAVNDDPISLERLRIFTSDTGVAGASFRVFLYNATFTALAGDNAAFQSPQANFIGAMVGSFYPALTFSTGNAAILVPEQGIRILTPPTSGAQTIFGLIQTLTAFTPSANSTTFNLTLEASQGRT